MGQKPDQFPLPVRVGHRFSKIVGISRFQLLYGIDARGLQQFGVFLAHAFYAHTVGDVCPV